MKKIRNVDQILTFQFPYCDGAHVEHNKTTGDNVGPLVLSKKSD